MPKRLLWLALSALLVTPQAALAEPKAEHDKAAAHKAKPGAHAEAKAKAKAKAKAGPKRAGRAPAEPARKGMVPNERAGHRAERASDNQAQRLAHAERKAAQKAAGKTPRNPGASEGAAERGGPAAHAGKHRGHDMQARANSHSRAKRARSMKWKLLKAHLGDKVTKVEKGKNRVPHQVRAEMRKNAKRHARLFRIRALAQDNGDKDSTAKVHALILKESNRHERRMAALLKKLGATQPKEAAK